MGLLAGQLTKGRSALVTLQLRQNGLTDKLASILGDFLKSSIVTDLDLSYNSLSDPTGLSIAKALERNKVLVNLNLQGNLLKSQTGEALCKATLQNHTL